MDLEQISKDYGFSVDELKTVEAGLRKKYSISIIPAAELEKYIEQGVMSHVNRYKDLGLVKFYAVILNASQPKDGVQKRRSEAIKKYVADAETAIAGGSVQEWKDGNKKYLYKGVVVTKPVLESPPKTAVYLPDQKAYVVPLDDRATWPNGKSNFGYLKPLPFEQFFMNVEGIRSTDGANWSAFKMTFNCDEHTKVPQSQLMSFYAKVKPGDPSVLAFNNKYTKFEPVQGDVTALNGYIMAFYDVVNLSEIDNTFRNQKNKYDQISVLGRVSSKWLKEPTEDKPHPWMTVNIKDNTRDTPLKLLCHPGVNVNFEEQSIVKAWGSLSEGNKWDPELNQATEEKEITMFCTGIHQLTIPDDMPEEKQDDGWGDQ